MAEFFERFPSEYADGADISGVQEQFLCVPTLPGEDVGKRSIAIPSRTRETANQQITDFAQAVEFNDIAMSTTFWLESGIETLINSRQLYLDEIKKARPAWEAAGKPYNQQWSENLFEIREKVRIQTRRTSPVPMWFYKFTDDVRSDIRQRDIRSGKKGGTPYSFLVGQDYKKTIDGALSANDAPMTGLKFSRKAMRALQVANVILTAVEISRMMTDLYAAQTPAEEEAAMRAVFAATGEALLQTTGAGGGALLCGAVTFSSAGFGAVTCGVLTVGGGLGGGWLGRKLGQAAYQIVSNSSAEPVRNIVSGSLKPILNQ